MTAWPDLDAQHPYGAHHLPYGVLRTQAGRRIAAVRLGECAVDLTGLFATSRFGPLFTGGSLTPLLAAGRRTWAEVRAAVVDSVQPANRSRTAPFVLDLDTVTELLPVEVADYVDFYASEHHATNVGRIFRPDDAPLTPNWKHLPIGYHGRAGTIVVSGTPVRRPHGQTRQPDGTVTVGPSQRLDFEAEVAFVVGAASQPGRPVPVAAFRDHVFGVCLLNDWSARDIQAWEYVPLGPFLGKSFVTSVSAWITPLDALAGAWTAAPLRQPQVADYLDDSAEPAALDLALEVRINGHTVSRPPFTAMYWTGPQLVAHTTANGAHLRTGDVLASGTVSGSEPDQRGSLLELSWAGAEPLQLPDGSSRAFLHDGDDVVLAALARGTAHPVALGEVRGRVVAASPGGVSA